MGDRSVEAFLELSPSLAVSELSPGAQQLYGLEPNAVLGRALSEVLLTDAGPIDWAEHWRLVRSGRPFERVMLHRSLSGLRIWVHARLEARPGGARLTVRAASGREVLEQQPGGVVQALGRMLAIGGVGLWLDDRVIDEFDWSELARALHGLGPDVELSPALLFSRIHPDDRGQLAAEIQRGIAEHLPYDGKLRVSDGQGGHRHVHVFGGSTYDAAGLPLLSLGGVRDISEELALKRRVRELEDQLRAAQRGDVVGRLAGGIAHDFNNILTGILGCCEMLERRLGSGDEEDQRDLEQIRSATLRAADLTRQLLAFGRRQALQPRAVAPAAVLGDVLGLLRRTLPENVAIELEPGQCRGRVLVDVTQLHQVLTNLIVNAAQAMPEGGRIEISAAQVRLPDSLGGNDSSPEQIRFAVEDSGPGVPEALRARIFEPFFTTKAPGQGSGLGLSVVQGIVEQHRGRIRVDSGALGGARFEVYLPATEQVADNASDAPEPPTEAQATSLRVMLVEDEKMVRELTKRILIGAGFRVTEAVSAEQALPRIEEGEFDLLLTDVVLPAMSGPELVRRVRGRGRELPVVYMSGYPADFVESRVQLGESDILVHKPFTAAALISALRQRAARPAV
ncbi:MAG TPA: ATP-binding protein [Polyangiaceae bacterium]|nr:ATP-binding protein [Polyangiaceae bacterium]